MKIRKLRFKAKVSSLTMAMALLTAGGVGAAADEAAADPLPGPAKPFIAIRSWDDVAAVAGLSDEPLDCGAPATTLIMGLHYRNATNRTGEAYRLKQCLESSDHSATLAEWTESLPDSPFAAFLRADTLARSGQVAEAIDLLEQIPPSIEWLRPSILNALASLYYRTDPEMALAIARESVASDNGLDCTIADNCYVAGMLELVVNADNPRARQLFEATWQADSSHPLAYAGFVIADSLLNEVETQSDEFFEALTATSPPSPLRDYAIASLAEASEAIRGRVGSYQYSDYSQVKLNTLGAWGSITTASSQSYNPHVGGANVQIEEGKNMTRTYEGNRPVTFTTY